MPHHHEDHGPHHNHPHPHGPHHGGHRGWITSTRNPIALSKEVGEHLIELGEALAAGETIEANGVVIEVAEHVLLEFVYERNHKGNKVMRFHLEWGDHHDEDEIPSRELRLSKRNRTIDGEGVL
jgi:hypothetical protein